MLRELPDFLWAGVMVGGGWLWWFGMRDWSSHYAFWGALLFAVAFWKIFGVLLKGGK